MKVTFHKMVFEELDLIMSYYEAAAGTQLADDFYAEFYSFLKKAAMDPEVFSIRLGNYRRTNLDRFPYNFIFRMRGDSIYVLAVRHHARHPDYRVRRR